MKQPTTKQSPTPTARKRAAGARTTTQRSWVRRHPALVLGTVAAGVGAIALLTRKGGKRKVAAKAKVKAGARARKSAR